MGGLRGASVLIYILLMQHMDRFPPRQMEHNQLTNSGWEDTADHYQERDKKFGTSEGFWQSFNCKQMILQRHLHRQYLKNLYINKMFFYFWEPLGIFGSCRTRIQGWSNPRVDWTDAVAFSCPWEYLGPPVTNLVAPTTILGAHRITVVQSGKNIVFFGNTAGVAGNHSYYLCFNDY